MSLNSGRIAGPLAAMLLGDQGAEVIRIARPGRAAADIDGVLDRSKRVLRLDLRTDAGRAAALALIAGADIVIENFAPGALDRLGLSVPAMRAGHPSLIVVSLPGFDGPNPLAGDAKAFEDLIGAVTGRFTNIHAARETFGLDPVYTPLPLASVYAGVHAATAAVLALCERDTRGAVALIRVPLANAALLAMSTLYLDIERQPARYSVPRVPGVVKAVVLPLIRAYARRRTTAQSRLLSIARRAYPALMTSYACADGRRLYLFAVDNHKLVRAALATLCDSAWKKDPC